LLQGTVQEEAALQGLDSNNIDEATMQQLIDDAWPGALAQADAWTSTLDPAVLLPQSNIGECLDLGCPNSIVCDSKYYNKQIPCFIQACGDAKCKACPDWFGPLKNMLIKYWCSYVCMDGTAVLGSAALVKTVFGPEYQRCILP
jgi:hypothetical protein